MSNRAFAIACALETEMPEIIVHESNYTNEAHQVSVADGPVVVVSDGIGRGITLSIYSAEGDNISGIAAEVHRAASAGTIALFDSEMRLSFSRMVPILDESDFLIGERIHYIPIEHDTGHMKSAA